MHLKPDRRAGLTTAVIVGALVFAVIVASRTDDTGAAFGFLQTAAAEEGTPKATPNEPPPRLNYFPNTEELEQQKFLTVHGESFGHKNVQVEVNLWCLKEKL